ncbi:MAG: sugar transferase [bacterium]|jgi:lipopolysaccharide/colanic/teichoic acid biosynthesis glycosyltransferase|nr:sugar transferase [bacterium]MBK7770571.1 sugar transferase [bacterium]MBK9775131.1 sugar transferase [bacterium]
MAAEYFYGDRAGYERFVDTRCCSGAAPGRLYAFAKRAFDVAAALAGLFLLLPLLPFIVLLIKLETPGPVLFRQKRVGRCGRLFDCFKFRSMAIDAETRKDQLRHLNEANGAAFKIKDDPRITGVGRFLRRSSLDEFPQLLNVLRGEMSIVGPRPQIPGEVADYTPQEAQRLLVKPGLTCLWQVSGRSHLDFSEWMELDRQYVAAAGPGLDFRILVRTLPAVIQRKGAY